ncbi:MAG: isp [Firmicutes bacterium]|nr:isp [Bacillota bacterium]
MPDYRLIPYTIESVTDTVNEIPEGVKMVQAPEIWGESKKGAGVVVAVIDSGCKIDHRDLKDCIIGKRNFTDEGSQEDVTDYSGHGTHVAGTIAAIENRAGVVGVAPQAKLLIAKVMKRYTENGETSYGASNKSIIEAIRFCIAWRGPNQERVRVINMSLGGPEHDAELHKAVQEAVQNDIVVVCAAGNEGEIEDGGDCSPVGDEFSYPGAYPEVLSVGAIDLKGSFPCFTNTNLEVDLVAPGVNIMSTYNKPEYATLSGTSMASPHVAGATALLINLCEKKFGRSFTEPEIYAQLIKRTHALGNDPKIEGNGLLTLLGPCAVIDGVSPSVKLKEPALSHS